ncbi:MAG: hypothetical protein MUO88_04445, partial [Desulfobacterales bacterium]|nr:hypothetical protein [Desulfobacterales bacterium]
FQYSTIPSLHYSIIPSGRTYPPTWKPYGLEAGPEANWGEAPKFKLNGLLPKYFFGNLFVTSLSNETKEQKLTLLKYGSFCLPC